MLGGNYGVLTRRSPGANTWSAVSLALLTLATVGLGAASAKVGDIFSDHSTGGVLGGILLVLAAGALTVQRLRHDRLDAPALYALATVTFLGLTSVAWLGEPVGPRRGLDQVDIAEALRLVAVGLLAFGLGVRFTSRADRPKPFRLDLRDAPPPTVLVALFGMSLITVLGALAVGAYGYVSDPLAVARLASVGQLLAALAAVGNLVLLTTALSFFATGDRRLRLLMILFASVEMAVGFAGGLKGVTILPLLFILVSYVSVRGRVPVTGLVLGAVVVLVFVVPINLRYREAVRADDQPPTAALRVAVSTSPELNPVGALEGAEDYVLTRFRLIDSVALIRAQTPSPFPFAAGRVYPLLPAIVLVPRAVWPDKPKLNATAEFTYTYAGVSREVRSSTPITHVGDLYRNFGYPGVLVGLFLWGLVIGVGVTAYRRWASPRATLIYAYGILTVVISTETDLPALIANASKALPVAAVVAWLLLPGRASVPGYRALGRPRRLKPLEGKLGSAAKGE